MAVQLQEERMLDASIERALESGEGPNIEFKERFTSRIGEAICAFANASGGQIFVGISNNGKIKGVKKINDMKS